MLCSEAGSVTESQEEGRLAENMNSLVERLEVVEGSTTGEEGKGSASVFRYVMDEKEEDRSALDSYSTSGCLSSRTAS